MGSSKSKPKRISRYEDDSAAADSRGGTEINNVKNFERVHSDRVTSLTVFNQKSCLSGSCDTNLGIFDFEEGKLCTKWKGHDKDITKVCFGTNKEKKIVFSASRDKTIKSWLIDDNFIIELRSIYHGHNLVVTAIDRNADCSILCSGSRDNCIKLWDTKTNQCIRTNTVTRNLITCVKWFPTENLITQTGEDKILRIWDSRSLEVAFAFPPKQYFATCCDVSKDGRFILTSSNGFNGVGCESILWDVRGKKQIYTYKGHQQTVSSCAFLPRLTDITSWPLIITTSSDSTVKVWNQETQKCLAEENFFGSGPLTDIAVWDNGRFCVSSSDYGIYQLALESDDEGGVLVKCQSHF